jgi:hypothetical protein
LVLYSCSVRRFVPRHSCFELRSLHRQVRIHAKHSLFSRRHPIGSGLGSKAGGTVVETPGQRPSGSVRFFPSPLPAWMRGQQFEADGVDDSTVSKPRPMAPAGLDASCLTRPDRPFNPIVSVVITGSWVNETFRTRKTPQLAGMPPEMRLKPISTSRPNSRLNVAAKKSSSPPLNDVNHRCGRTQVSGQ